jgi:hypothetical protein
MFASRPQILLLSLVVCALGAATMAQSTWLRFSTPDKSLSIALPGRPETVTNKQESAEVIFENVRSSYIYQLRLRSTSDVPEISFGVLHLSKRLTNRTFDDTVNSNMLWIGGDDKHFSRKADVRVGGFHGREFTYEKGNVMGRALFVNGGRRIYFLMFQTEDEGEATAERVSRIFKSFQPQR